MHPEFAAITVIVVDAVLVSAWILHEICWMSKPVPLIMIFVFPAFNLFSMAFFHVESLLTYTSSESAMITRSSPSQGTPEQNSGDIRPPVQ